MARKRWIPSHRLTRFLGRVLAAYVRFCGWTIRWQGEGREALARQLAEGPVVFVVWHGRLLYSAAQWPREAGVLGTIHDPSPAGAAAGALLESFGAQPLPVKKSGSDLGALRAAITALRGGVSIGLAADGPTGPMHQAKAAPIDWARVAEKPVWLYSFSVKPSLRLKTWDRMMLPVPFARGRFIFREWEHKVSRHASEADLEEARAALTDALNALEAEADRRSGAL